MSKTWFTSGILDDFVVLDFVGVDPLDEQEDGEGVSLDKSTDDDDGVELILSSEESSMSNGLKVVMTQAAAIRLGLNDEKTSCAEHIVINVSECFLNVSDVIPTIAWNWVFRILWIMCSTKSKAITADMSQSNLDNRSTSHSYLNWKMQVGKTHWIKIHLI